MIVYNRLCMSTVCYVMFVSSSSSTLYDCTFKDAVEGCYSVLLIVNQNFHLFLSSLARVHFSRSKRSA